MKFLAFTKVRLPGGWMGNMSAHSVYYNDVFCKTTEHLFQALRLDPELKNENAQAVLAEASPMSAKFVAKALIAAGHSVVQPWSQKDLDNMAFCVKTKADQHPDLVRLLSATDKAILIEDTTNRARPDTFWGARLGKLGEIHPDANYPVSDYQYWIGHNWLGEFWMAERRSRSLF